MEVIFKNQITTQHQGFCFSILQCSYSGNHSQGKEPILATVQSERTLNICYVFFFPQNMMN